MKKLVSFQLFFVAFSLGSTGCVSPDDEVGSFGQEALASTSLSAGAFGVKTDTVCFSVHNPGDPGSIAVTGTRFSQRSLAGVQPDQPVILLLHGAAETRQIFDGGKAGVAVASSFARRLARAGYLVVTVDRVGYGDSPYLRGPGAGFALNFNSYVEMTHDIVTQLHDGSYTHKMGPSCGTGETVGLASESVILGGHSSAGGHSMQYAMRYHDIDALISFAWNNTGAASIPSGFFINWIVPQFLQGQDYVTFFPPGDSGISDACVLGFYSQPLADTAVDPAIVDIECANENLELSPSGELASTPQLRAANLAAIGGVGQTPTLLTFADLDAMVSGANNPAGDPDYSGQEIALWEQSCNCDVSNYTEPESGHAMFFPDTMPQLADAVIDWLASRGLGAR